MREDLRERLRCWLGRDVRALDELSDVEVEQLHAVFVDERNRQAEALRASAEQALRQIPAFLRRTIDKIMGE